MVAHERSARSSLKDSCTVYSDCTSAVLSTRNSFDVSQPAMHVREASLEREKAIQGG